MINEHELVKGCIKDDAFSQEAIYKLFYKKMFRVCMRYSKNHDDAKDTLQESFIKVFSKIKDYNGSGPLEGWIRRLVINTNLSKLREQKSRKYFKTENIENILGVDERDVEETTDMDDYMDISKEDIMSAVQGLSIPYRTVFNMHVVDGFSHKEISEKLEINIGTSKSNLYNAKFKLRESLDKMRKKYESS